MHASVAFQPLATDVAEDGVLELLDDHLLLVDRFKGQVVALLGGLHGGRGGHEAASTAHLQRHALTRKSAVKALQ